ncbi:capsular polysaccharide biosynthesis protein [Cupriavidus sp. MP-37]|uniref:capsular polysaccharide biosynthesis protein n=1 Tax=Cupriavidus sp. MP-37 TaxID=2884455 RepID=UPI001D0BAC9E|nr:glycosyltransferase family 29 protein [Cupriavidus sp. MP-37]UDM53331.1 glycosyltransferase family 29 protein [Cupriavidus sp. MP-37]
MIVLDWLNPVGWGLLWWAQRRRAQGRYERATERAFAMAWRMNGTLTAWLAYAMFRRDLGRPLPRRWQRQLSDALSKLPPHKRRQALGLLAEAGGADRLSVQRNDLMDAAMLPALADLAQANVSDGDAGWLAELHRKQPQWRAAFARWVTDCCQSNGLCVVGNAGVLKGRGLGAHIDRAGGVVRFNRFARGECMAADVGRRLDVWVVAPGYRGRAPESPDWIVVTGPDMRYRMQDWQLVMPFLKAGVPVLTVPLGIWRELVTRLKAPPSAGVLLLHWLQQLKGDDSQKGLSFAGIGQGVVGKGTYHLALPHHKPVERHNWKAERRMVEQWRRLEPLGNSSAPPQSAAAAPGFAAFSRALYEMPLLGELLGGPVVRAWLSMPQRADVAVGWGFKKSGERARNAAQRAGTPYLCLEDGFLRSFGTGEHFPPLAVVVDDVGIYYDSTRPSALENLLNSDADLLAGIRNDAARAKELILKHRLSKYNHAPDRWLCSRSEVQSGQQRVRKVLVVDQTAGDMSVKLGGAQADTFLAMLSAACAENPGSTIYVKTHPEVASGRKGGYLTHVQESTKQGQRVVLLRQSVNPIHLLEQVDRVYVVTSTMGFEALLLGKPVTCFGRPWYAGWGATDDRQASPRRTRKRSVDELFAAAYFHYTRYLDPVSHRRGTIFDVIQWLVRQKAMAANTIGVQGPRRMICVGFRRWRGPNVRPLLSLDRDRVTFVHGVAAARDLSPQPGEGLVFWGSTAPEGVRQLAQERGAKALRMEDGFVRSVGLGSDLIRPLSLVLDERGIYFDPSRPSDLEHLLSTTIFSHEELGRASQVRAFIAEHGITKYNVEPRAKASWLTGGRLVVLVPGQVEDDASIRLGCTDVKSNLGLLRSVRGTHPDAFIVYKPHPDVVSGNRVGKMALGHAREYADHVETNLSVVSCIEACDEVHTMTSLAGFDALLREKRVVTYGQPFYAGWGLTTDLAQNGIAFTRRTRRLKLDELVAGTLLRYPIYWDWELKGYTDCEAVLQRIVETRNQLELNGDLEKLKVGSVRRAWRKLRVWARNSLL